MRKESKQKLRKIIVKSIFGLSLLMLLVNCSKNLPGVGCATGSYIQDWSDAQEALAKASQTYANDDSVESCTNYKNAINNYLNTYEDISSCLPAATVKGLEDSIEESRKEAAEIDCSN